MQEILFGYKLNPTTWAYISALMMVGIYFKFHRFWSIRNLDLIGLLCFSPGFLLVYYGLLNQKEELVRNGYIWLFAVNGFFLIRLLVDSLMVRRPLLDPNLSASGLTFTGASLLIFLMANVITNPAERLENLLSNQDAAVVANPNPGYQPFQDFAKEVGRPTPPLDPARPDVYRAAFLRSVTTRSATIFAHLLIVSGMVWIGFRHFDNIHTGVAAATLYLLTFYTSQMTRQIDHVAPAALLVWAVAAYRWPVIAGILVGAAAGLIYYPLFLLPLWCSFYWRRGLVRFLVAVAVVLLLMVASLALTSPDVASFFAQVKQMFGLRNPLNVQVTGLWHYLKDDYRVYRLPVIAAFAVVSAGLAFWPAQKNFGTLLACSAAVLLATQFWLADEGGLVMGWYLPLLILTIFRPNLEDRVALSAVQPAWGRRKKS